MVPERIKKPIKCIVYKPVCEYDYGLERSLQHTRKHYVFLHFRWRATGLHNGDDCQQKKSDTDDRGSEFISWGEQ